MPEQSDSTTSPMQLIRMGDGLIVHQALYAAAALSVADLLEGNACTTSDLAAQLAVNEDALYRLMRFLASHGVFEETSPRTFANTDLSCFLRSGVPGSVRSFLIFRGSEVVYAPFGEIIHSIQTGQPAREKLYGANVFDYLKTHPELARAFDEGMTSLSQLVAPEIAKAYDFATWGSLMDVGGGNGILLASILRVHLSLHGVLADLPHVIERASERGFLGGDLQARSRLQFCDFFQEVPAGCRACLMKHVIHDWDDERAHRILINCRRSLPENGALLLVEYIVPEGNSSSVAKTADMVMMLMTGGKERTLEEYRELLAGAGFRLNRALPVAGDLSIIESLPV
ncbi:MAG: hypothetical protein JO108_00635 [Acidobacteriaceae bacterium]|nr:hypothetical protein [Acidobacteriaceae bacterium]